MPPQTTFTALTAGRDHTCGITPLGAAWCWGRNFAGAVGDGTIEHRLQPTAVMMPAGVSFTGISAGFAHTCAVATDGQGWCWGYNEGGRLGDGTTQDRNAPVKVIQLLR
jgi:alpha-tubulin suppressor-like RCC1 family protein